MKSIIVTIATLCAAATVLLAAPRASYAQSPLTRAQVRQELLDLESVGYDPSAGDADDYPEGIVAAQARLEEKRAAERRSGEAAYGSGGAPRTSSGAAAVAAANR
ncbi:DUF4148 domain-containing protein [Burkholderia vietnamiensis]|jgi:hypothetical protein|uniref:DUF4148 domain-containing protein n=1 Tax=Burkholderia vietnamiensis TaxID=60552 RepID=UPI0007547554|nr:DUF4148 domain-containing protein [Burkholderia vietnamiensis]AOK42703.1 hypothetical protein WL96_16230 [Burkholderia vietnamiensis]KVF02862.1 hypothetical protein WJ04_25290 [Burkholderia vietnamiensis]KVF38401.1 hypothetical protein WJ09_02165 [Burkholderia vietnamiensis]KVR76407.1 hypothetical protein WK26_24430 [Burkholderia vietnamiensis]KVR79708.1 hypothetical protein WK24_31000 [Burkholderia vietnamiensis]